MAAGGRRRGAAGRARERAWAFARAQAMPLVACFVALVTCIFVPPDRGYAAYEDWGTLARIAAMLAVVAALREAGVFQAVATRLVTRMRGAGALVAVLVAVTGLASMFVTNDMALLALLPLAAATLIEAERDKLIAPVFVLQGLAANLWGMLLPFGNPQNIFLSAAYGIGLGDFLATMAPPFAASILLVGAACAAVGRWAGRGDAPVGANPAGRICASQSAGSANLTGPDVPVTSPGRVAALLVLLAVCVASVLGIVPAWLALVVVLAALLALDRGPRGLVRTDWGLIVTFAAFFIVSGNLARIGAVQQAFAAWLADGAFLPGALLSQVISNVPAAVLLQRFTGDWAGLLAGVNVGGAGTPVGSLATLIVIAQFGVVSRGLPASRRARLRSGCFWPLMLGLNIGALVALLTCGIVLGW